MAPRLSSASDGRGEALTALVAAWAARNPRVRRVWSCESHAAGALALALELQPVGDSEETMALWMAHCDQWRDELRAQVGEAVSLDWYDPDTESTLQSPVEMAKALVYERAR
jgi:hypothetical protein